MNYLTEFPMFDDVLPSIEGFHDSSWHNDSCPSLGKELKNGAFISVFVDYKNKELSDFSDLEGDNYYRFRVGLTNQIGEYIVLFESNSFDEIRVYIKSKPF